MTGLAELRLQYAITGLKSIEALSKDSVDQQQAYQNPRWTGHVARSVLGSDSCAAR